MSQMELDPSHIMQVGMGFWPSKTVLSAVELQLFTHLGAETMGQPVADDDAHSGLLGEDGGRGGSGGVLRSGQSTKGPDRNRSRVATMMAIATQGE